MLQDLLLVAPSSNMYTVSTLLFYEDVRDNVGFNNFMSHFYMFVPTKTNMKLANGNMIHAQKMRLSYVVLLTVPLYINCNQLVIVQVTVPIPSN